MSFLFYFLISRIQPGFYKLNLSDPTQLVYVKRDVNGNVSLKVSGPHACLEIRRGDIESNHVEELTISQGNDSRNGSSNLESLEIWSLAIHHLLDTFHPTSLKAHCVGPMKQLKEKCVLGEKHRQFYFVKADLDQEFLNISM